MYVEHLLVVLLSSRCRRLESIATLLSIPDILQTVLTSVRRCVLITHSAAHVYLHSHSLHVEALPTAVRYVVHTILRPSAK
jgi:hypothetical protein